MAAGETRHVVVDRLRGIRADLVVRISPGRLRPMRAPLAEVTTAGAMPAGGHTAQFQCGRRREGIVFRRLVPAARLQCYCDRTRRTVQVELSGSLGDGELRALMEAFGNLECHVADGESGREVGKEGG